MGHGVTGNDWSEIIYHADENMLELNWLSSSESMGDAGSMATLMQLTWQAETLRPTKLFIDATNFKHQVGESVMVWRKANVLPRYSAAGVKKFGFYIPGFPHSVESGTEPTVEEGATFVTGWFSDKANALTWLNK